MDAKIIIREIIRENISKLFEEEYFEPTLPEDVKERSVHYTGRNILWYGDPDQMVVIHKDQVDGMYGNIYDSEKIEFLKDMILNHEDMIEIECSYGIGSVVGITNIMEEQESVFQGSFETDYEGSRGAASAGDEELDGYLGNEDYMDDNELLSLLGVDKFFKKHKASIARGLDTPQSLKEKFQLIEVEDGEDKDEGDYDAFKEFIRLELYLKEAQDNEYGNFNEFRIQSRDGHHRIAAAIESGENYVCINLVKEDIEEFKGRYTKI